MGKHPRLIIDLKKIDHNSRIISGFAARQSITITGVTKATCGDPKIAKAMLDGGAVSIGDSRIENIKRLRNAGIKAELMLLRTPMLSEVEEVIRYADISLNSEITVIKRLSDEAAKRGTLHRVLLMIEMGELREGLNKEELDTVVEIILGYEGIELYGLGMNLTCMTGVVPTEEKIAEFVELVFTMEEKFKIKFKMIGGGNSANIPLLLNNFAHSRINNLRIGEGILLGVETVNRTPIPSTYQDAFILESELIELKEKQSIPEGDLTQNAFGESPTFEDLGRIKRGILAIGRQDVIVDGLEPMDNNISILGSSSDHIVVHIDSSEFQVGDIVKFRMNYGALVHLFTSEYVMKDYVN